MTITNQPFALPPRDPAEGGGSSAEKIRDVFLAIAAAVATAAAAPTSSDLRSLGRVVTQIVHASPMDRARLGIDVVDGRTGRTVYARDAGNEFAPASNFKLLLAATALADLGPAFRFRTRVEARGTIDAGTLHGDLVLVGGGDPVLSRNDLAQAAAAVKRAGIVRVDGAVLFDDALFDEQRYGEGWAWDDMPFYYQPPIQALSVDEGVAEIVLTPGVAVGDPVTASLESNENAMTVDSRAITSGRGGLDDFDCFRSPGGTMIHAVGHLPLGSGPTKLECAVDDSAAYAAGVLSSLLRDDHVAVAGQTFGAPVARGEIDIADSSTLNAAPVDPPDVLVVWRHSSPSLAMLLDLMMPESDNFIAEHLFKMLPVVVLHQRGSFAGGGAVEGAFLKRLHLDSTTVEGGDGSGLSQGDRITPQDLATILLWESRRAAGQPFVRSLAVAGLNGTVSRRLVGSDAAGRVRAKDGYIWHVYALSGYAQTLRHGLAVFSIIVNDANGPADPYVDAEDKIVETIVDWP